MSEPINEEHTAREESTRSRIPEDLKETAQQVWYAGLGALETAEKEGGKLFRKLVDAGRKIDQRVRTELDEGVEGGSSLFRRLVETSERIETRVLDKAEDRFGERFGEARERVEATWDEVETSLRRLVDQAMERVGGTAGEKVVMTDEPVTAVPTVEVTDIPEPAITETDIDEPEGGSETVEKTLGREGAPALVTIRPVGGGWYEIEKNGQIVDKVQGKDNAREAMRIYL